MKTLYNIRLLDRFMKSRFFHFRRAIWFGSFLGRRFWIVPLLLAVPYLAWPGLFQALFHDEWQPIIVGYTIPLNTKSVYLIQYVSDFSKWLMNLTGASIPMMRLPYLLFGILSVLCGWRLGRAWRNWTAGFLLALLLAIWPLKIYYDSMIREYAIEICLFVAMFVQWESYRLRRTTLSLTVALTLTLMTALTHELAIIALAVPPCYLAHRALARAIAAFRGRHQSGADRAWWRQLLWRRQTLAFGCQAILALFFMIWTVQFHRGPDYPVAIGEKIMETVWPFGRPPQPMLGKTKQPEAAKAAGATAHASTETPEAARARKIAAREAVVPTTAEAAGFIADSIRQLFSQPKWSAAPLLGLANYRHTFNEIITSPLDKAVPPRLRAWIPGLSLFFLVAGSLALAFKSPPLLACLWILIFGNALVVNFNLHLTSGPGARYYIPATVAALFAIVALLESPAGLIQRAFARRPRRRAWALMAFNLAMGAALIIPARAITRNFAPLYADSENDELKHGFVKTMNDVLRPGILFLGNEPLNWEFLNTLQTLREERQDAGFWETPRRNTFVDISSVRTNFDLGLIDRLNYGHAFVLFHWNSAAIPTMLVQYADMFKFETRKFRSLTANFCELGHRVFITRGHATLPLQPRFEEKKDAGKPATQYRLDLHHEIPGVYELAIGQTPTCRVTAIEVGGESCDLQSRARSSTRDLTQDLDEMLSHYPVKPGQARPFHTEAATETVVRYAAPPESMHRDPQAITITFDNPPGNQLPILRWTYAEDTWTTVTADWQIGPLQIEERADRFLLGAPLRLSGTPKRSQMAVVYLTDTADLKKSIYSKVCVFDRRQRDRMQDGDIFWVGPIQFTKAPAREWLNKTMVLTVHPQNFKYVATEDIKQSTLIAPRQRHFAPLNQFLLTYLKFAENNGQIGLMTGLPQETPR